MVRKEMAPKNRLLKKSALMLASSDKNIPSL
jgi:hypothetical protein